MAAIHAIRFRLVKLDGAKRPRSVLYFTQIMEKAMDKPIIVGKNPLVIMWENTEEILCCALHPPEGLNHGHYGLLVCDLVRHIANHFGVPAGKVWYWVDKERAKPTTDISLDELRVKDFAEFVEHSSAPTKPKKGNGNGGH
jgi:hypothetical protein